MLELLHVVVVLPYQTVLDLEVVITILEVVDSAETIDSELETVVSLVDAGVVVANVVVSAAVLDVVAKELELGAADEVPKTEVELVGNTPVAKHTREE